MINGLPAEWGTCFRTVAFDDISHSLTCWEGTIAVGLGNGGIVILDGTTGSQTTTLSSHNNRVHSLIFSSDGTSLVSGSQDRSVKLWDMQTGGVVNTFRGHKDSVSSVSISLASTTIASGSRDGMICLWDVQTGGCRWVIERQGSMKCVIFSPTSSQYLISVSGGKVQQWDLDDYKINHSHNGSCAAFSPDGTQLVSCQRADIIIQDPDFGVLGAKFHMPNSTANNCCFSSDGKLVAVADEHTTVYVWDITGSNPRLVETLIGHSMSITSLVFPSPSSLITSSLDQSAKFWKIGTPSTDSVAGHPKPTLLASAPIKSITLQARNGVFASSHSDGMMRIWDISTGLCKISPPNPAKNKHQSDVRLIDNRLILVWYADRKIHIWDVEKEKLLQEIQTDWPDIHDIRISGDGSKVFCLREFFTRAWSIWTGELVGEASNGPYMNKMSLIVDKGSGVWVHHLAKEGRPGWNFGIPDSPPSHTSSLHLSDTKEWDVGLSRIRDMSTGKVVLQFGGRSTDPIDIQSDGSYLIVCYESGEASILDFNDVVLQ